MPELPEIESIRRSLLFLQSDFIENFKLSSLAPVEHCSKSELLKKFNNTQLVQISRRGKYLLFENDQSCTLVIHLGMSGKLLYFKNTPHPIPLHTHATFVLKNKGVLLYIDPRRFGTLSLSLEANDNPFLNRLGPDYDHPNFNLQQFITQCRRHPKLQLKTLCLNQSVAAGLGNIYACEALYHARLSPLKLVQKTKDAELERLFQATRQVLKLGIEKGGSSLKDYLDGLGNRGVMKDFLQVYDREGQKTLDGLGKVIRITQQNRSTWYCPELQK